MDERSSGSGRLLGRYSFFAGSWVAVFRPTDGPVPLDSFVWCTYEPGACRNAPDRPCSDVVGRQAHRERAARGGLDGARFAWGDEECPGGTGWQKPGKDSSRGRTPHSMVRGHSPVGPFPAKRLGPTTSSAMSGSRRANQSLETPPDIIISALLRCARSTRIHRRRGAHQAWLLSVRAQLLPSSAPAARPAHAVDTSTGHIGIRCVLPDA